MKLVSKLRPQKALQLPFWLILEFLTFKPISRFGDERYMYGDCRLSPTQVRRTAQLSSTQMPGLNEMPNK